MSDPQGQSIHNLLGDALRESADLARKELTLFRSEMTENVRGLVAGLVMMVAAAVFAIVALSLLTQSLVEWLATVVNSEALASLIVAVLMAVIAVGLVLYGRSKFNATSLAPTRTAKNILRDTEVLSERVST
jgi:branched-subunit amino acid permease